MLQRLIKARLNDSAFSVGFWFEPEPRLISALGQMTIISSALTRSSDFDHRWISLLPSLDQKFLAGKWKTKFSSNLDQSRKSRWKINPKPRSFGTIRNCWELLFRQKPNQVCSGTNFQVMWLHEWNCGWHGSLMTERVCVRPYYFFVHKNCHL